MDDEGSPRHDDALGQVVEWAIDHMEVEANFEGVPVLLVGDPLSLVGQAPINVTNIADKPWAWLPAPATGLMVRGPHDGGDGPWVWVVATDDGPAASVEVSPELEIAPRGTEPQNVGTIHSASGRLVVGSPQSVLYWGPDIDVANAGRNAEMLVAHGIDGPMRDGFIVIVRLARPGPCSVLISPGTEPDQISAISIRLPTPDWLPAARPIVDRERP